MDETQDPTPHPTITPGPHAAQALPPTPRGESLSIWFFCGILTLGYGIVLLAQGTYEHFGHPHVPATVLQNLNPTFWWGLCLFLFGAFYTLRFRPGKA